MAHKTAWTRAGSSFPSDRIPSPRPQRSTTLNSSKGKGKKKDPTAAPKSDEVKRLEALLEALQRSPNGANPSSACFCQARQHGLSSYTPICRACGLILCNLNLPQYVCPHCSAALLTPTARDSLVKQLSAQIDETLVREAEDRERVAEDARRAVGAFPPLAGKTGTHPSEAPPLPTLSAHHPPNRPHKVMSLIGKTDKVVISSYYTTPMQPVTSHSETTDITEQPRRVPPPSCEVNYAKKGVDPAHPWADLRRGGLRYIPPSRVDDS